MFRKTCDDRNFSGTRAIDEEDGEEMNIYSNVDEIYSHDVCRATEDTRTNQTSQHTGSESVKNRSQRSVVVCLVVLCVLLLTAVIVLCVLNYTNNHQFNNITNITEERDQLLTNNIELAEELNQLQTNNIKLTEELNQLQTNNIKLTEEKDQLTQQINRLQSILNQKGWICYQSSLYWISSEKKSWTESRKYCRDRGTDLIIINNKEEQDFVKKYFSSENIWIGLSDSDVEGRWKWVDGSTLTSEFWGPEEPGGQRRENCVLSYLLGWADYPCNDAFKWICEKKINK